jgi:hypothetical protein
MTRQNDYVLKLIEKAQRGINEPAIFDSGPLRSFSRVLTRISGQIYSGCDLNNPPEKKSAKNRERNEKIKSRSV